MANPHPVVHKHLKADTLICILRKRFTTVPDPRPEGGAISVADALLSGFALFSLKDPSLLAFDQRRTEQNLQSVYQITRVPSDTQMRVICDEIDPEEPRPAFTDIFRQVQRGKALEPYLFLGNSYLLSTDGTEYFSSKKINCPHCMQRKHKNGEVTYYHQALNAVIVHPDIAEVIPLMPEPIQNQDGCTKNDCERNAGKRLFAEIHGDHPHMCFTILEDGLGSNGPHILEILSHDWHYILGAKRGDHEALFTRMDQAYERGEVQVLTVVDKKGVIHHYRWLSGVPLNGTYPNLLVNFLEYWEVSKDGVQYFSWVTDHSLNESTVELVARAGRARWKVENETHNTLKNQGYHYEHNFGHGAKNLSVVFVLLMMLAFLVDQVQQLCCTLFRAAWEKLGTKRALWEELRTVFRAFAVTSMQQLLTAIALGYAKAEPVILDNSS